MGSAARVRRGGASPGGMLVTADTMSMPVAAARAPIADFSPAPRSCAAPRSSRAQLKARRRAGGAGAAQSVQQRAQRSVQVDCGALKRPDRLQNISFPSAQLSGARCV